MRKKLAKKIASEYFRSVKTASKISYQILPDTNSSVTGLVKDRQKGYGYWQAKTLKLTEEEKEERRRKETETRPLRLRLKRENKKDSQLTVYIGFNLNSGQYEVIRRSPSSCPDIENFPALDASLNEVLEWAGSDEEGERAIYRNDPHGRPDFENWKTDVRPNIKYQIISEVTGMFI